jgi:hypothetical protein
MTTTEVAEVLQTSNKVVLQHAKELGLTGKILHGVPTEWNVCEVRDILASFQNAKTQPQQAALTERANNSLSIEESPSLSTDAPGGKTSLSMIAVASDVVSSLKGLLESNRVANRIAQDEYDASHTIVDTFCSDIRYKIKLANGMIIPLPRYLFPCNPVDIVGTVYNKDLPLYDIREE